MTNLRGTNLTKTQDSPTNTSVGIHIMSTWEIYISETEFLWTAGFSAGVAKYNVQYN